MHLNVVVEALARVLLKLSDMQNAPLTLLIDQLNFKSFKVQDYGCKIAILAVLVLKFKRECYEPKKSGYIYTPSSCPLKLHIFV